MEQIHTLFKSKVKNKNKKLKTVSECGSCGYLARDKDDLISIESEGVCTECRDNFKNFMIDEWQKGERPKREVARKRMNILIDEVWHEKPRSNT